MFNNNKEPNSVGILMFLVTLLLSLFIFPGFFSSVNTPAEESEEEPATVSEDRFINIIPEEVEDTTVPDDITFQKIELDADCKVLVINNVCYLVVDHGFGSSHSTALTVMYDEDGNILTYDKLYELGGGN